MRVYFHDLVKHGLEYFGLNNVIRNVIIKFPSLNYILLWIFTLEFPYYIMYIFSTFGMHWSRQFTASLRNINFLPYSNDIQFTYFFFTYPSLALRPRSPRPVITNLHIFLSLSYYFLLTLRRLMSYIYGAPILDVSRSHTTTQHSR